MAGGNRGAECGERDNAETIQAATLGARIVQGAGQQRQADGDHEPALHDAQWARLEAHPVLEHQRGADQPGTGQEPGEEQKAT